MLPTHTPARPPGFYIDYIIMLAQTAHGGGGSANIAAGPLELPDLAMDPTGTPKVAKGQVKRNENEENAFCDLFKKRAATKSMFKT